MTTRDTRLNELIAIAAEQGGYLTTPQAEAVGVGRRRLADLVGSGDLRRAAQGVYAMRHARLRADVEAALVAWLSVDRTQLPWQRRTPEAIISHDSAAAIHGLGTIIPQLPEITVERAGVTRGSAIHKHVSTVPPEEWEWLQVAEGLRLPVTTPARTIVDLAAAGADGDHLQRAVNEALARGQMRPGELEEVISRRRIQSRLRQWLESVSG